MSENWKLYVRPGDEVYKCHSSALWSSMSHFKYFFLCGKLFLDEVMLAEWYFDLCLSIILLQLMASDRVWYQLVTSCQQWWDPSDTNRVKMTMEQASEEYGSEMVIFLSSISESNLQQVVLLLWATIIL